ncbi:TrkA family potassium uptake protein [cf. Phormidesmis sp. LEGE 11477]|uniref:potassium channel family protein n=1 Tax=cf. Phormidesmis sp. LEGE 11477 TaxID=1828680 RepID=UPI0018804F5F|nr:NAD-binding protein [cf. Phormidesmis sp. LEGE 11477]MBE9063367.1 NAD-binding protein [cf. Phormidesmis sp. LEGE 11477]
MSGPDTLMPSAVTRSSSVIQDKFIICGLGSLGQQSVIKLKKFDYAPYEVSITAIERRIIDDWEIDDFPSQLAVAPILGDCRREDILRKAGIEDSRAILIVTSDESTNVECAIAARRLNPNIQIILRSSRHSLNTLLKRQLGNFVALDATELPAMTFALAGLGDDIVSVFTIGRHRFRIVERFVRAGDPRFDQHQMQALHQGKFRLLDFDPVEKPQQPLGWATTASSVFHRWQPYVRVSAGDRIAYIEMISEANDAEKRKTPFTALNQLVEDWKTGDWRRRLRNWRQSSEQSTERVLATVLVTALALWITGTLLLKVTGPSISWVKAISLGAILLLGGYGDVFGGFSSSGIPGWVQLVCLMITVVSILVVLGVLGLLADQLLSSRFDFLQKRPRIPRSHHVVVIGLGRIGRKVTSLLLELNQPLVAIDKQLNHPELFTQIPLLIGNILEELSAANLATAKSIIAVTDDQMLNLEVSLLASEKNLGGRRGFSPVVRTRNQSFSDNLAALMPQARSFCPYALSAEAFAGAAFGENILGLFRLSGQTNLIAEYLIEPGDTLANKQLTTVSYGYGVVPILRETVDSAGNACVVLMPTDDQYLLPGDHLFVLSSINGLRRIERGEMTPPRRWRLSVEQKPNPTNAADVVQLLARLTNFSPQSAQQFIDRLPATTDVELYDYQAARLIQSMKERLSIRLSPL